MELPEVNVVDSEAVEGAFEGSLSRRAGSTLARLGREEEVIGVAFEPGGYA